MGKHTFERFLFDLPVRICRLAGNGSQAAINRQKRLEAETERETEKEFVPVVRFAVASDLHIRTPDEPRNAERFADLFRTAYEYCDSHPTYSGLDAVLLVGDIADGGRDEEFEEVRRVIRENKRDETILIPVMGNHEFAHAGHDGFVRNMESPLEIHRVIKGFHILGLAPDPKDTWHTLRQILWMRRELQKAVRDDPDKSVFTMQHGHIFKTVYVSRTWFTQASPLLHAVYAKYPQIVNFSGHSHGPVNHPLSVWQKKYTLLGTGTLNYFEMERDIGDETVPAGSDRAAQYLIVETDARNRTRILPYDLISHSFFRKPSNADNAKTQLIHMIPRPTDRSCFAYTSARRKTDPPPRFAPDANASFERLANGALRVTFDQALSDVCTYGYRVVVREGRKKILTREVYSGYYYQPMPETCSCDLPGLPPGKRYGIDIIPLNVWRHAGKPLQVDCSL